jgi:two-component system, OmpR family, phosphate regulon sensor histidine kinase PhoR
MSETLGRVLAPLFGLALGALVGWLLGTMVHTPGWGAAIGALIGVASAATRDAVRAGRLLDWLRGAQNQPQSRPAPRDSGFWGEAGYRIEKALRSREHETATESQRLRQFLDAIDASPNGVLLLDADERIEWCNARAADHFGLDPEGDRRQIVTNLLRAPDFVAHLQAGAFEQPIEFQSPRGRATISVLVRPYGVGQKLLLSQDVTDRERMESMRRDFVANVSHEIRTPLTVLAGFVDTLASVPLSAAERPRVLELMRQQTTRIQTLVDDLLTLAQLEGSPRPSSDQWIPAAALVSRVAAEAEMLSAGRHDFTKEIEPGFEVAGIESELASAMGNLLGNAVRYTPDGGRIALRWSRRDGDERGAVFEVRDTGIGIAREHIPRLTERFYRVDGSRSRETGGTGLGLAIVKHVITRHGGELQIESEPGKGSTFRLLLPAVRVRARETAGESLSRSVAATPASLHPGR